MTFAKDVKIDEGKVKHLKEYWKLLADEVKSVIVWIYVGRRKEGV